jgi:hypothetical protein
MALTYADLAEVISKMTPEQVNQNVTIFSRETLEYYPTVDDYPIVQADDENDVIDSGQYYIVM